MRKQRADALLHRLLRWAATQEAGVTLCIDLVLSDADEVVARAEGLKSDAALPGEDASRGFELKGHWR